MNIKIIAVGKLKERYLTDAAAEYIKRLSRFGSVEIVEIPDKKIPDNVSEKQCEQLLNDEGDAIMAKITPTQYVVTLCVEAAQLSSEQFAAKLAECALGGSSNIAFVIGGSLGLASKVKNRADLRLGFSKMTFPHQLMRVILLEQVYRAFKINAGETYHK